MSHMLVDRVSKLSIAVAMGAAMGSPGPSLTGGTDDVVLAPGCGAESGSVLSATVVPHDCGKNILISFHDSSRSIMVVVVGAGCCGAVR